MADMSNIERYNKTEGNYVHGKRSARGYALYALLVAVLMVFLYLFIYKGDSSDSLPDSSKREIHNPDFYRMSVSDWEYIASNSRSRHDREDALYLLFNTYRKRSLLNLYDFCLRHRGEAYTEEALAIVIHKADSLYEMTKDVNTEQAWSDYLVTVPEDFHHDALDRYNEFRWAHTAELWDTEEKAWEQASRQKGKEAFKRYVKLYPDGLHVAEARREVRRLEERQRRIDRSYVESRRQYKRWIEKVNRCRKR